MYKKALVTGGERLGGPIAKYLALQGYDIALACESEVPSALVQEIEAAGVRCAVLIADLTDYQAACDLPARAAQALDGLSLCVNSSALPMTGVLDEQAYRTNLRAPYGIMAKAAEVMSGLDVQGAIVNVVPEDAMSMALERATRSAALEFSQFGINVNNVRHRDDVEETARCVAFFGSIGSDYMTGQMLGSGVQTGTSVPQPPFVKKAKASGRPCALITGASHGIGRGIAYHFADLGYNIAFTYSKRIEGAQETLQYLEQKGVRGFFYQATFDQEGAAEEVGRQALRDLGRIDVLVNNAGFTIFENRMQDVGQERLDKLFYSDYRAPMILTRIAAEDMRSRGVGGSIVNISSVHGSVHYIYDCWYGCVKYALNHATKMWAAELAQDGITVNAIAPGGTAVVPRTFEELATADRTPLGRCGRPLDMAKCAAFFASTQSVSGQTVVIDGGLALAGIPETYDPAVAGLGWSALRRRWNDDAIQAFKTESDWL